MPISYRVLEPSGVVVSTVDGDLDDAAVAEFVRDLVSDGRVRWPLCELADCRGLTGSPGLTTAGVREAARSLFEDPARSVGRIAIVVSGLFAFGLSRQFSIHAEHAGAEVEVFESLDLAIEWLDVGDLAESIRALLGEGGTTP